MKKKLGDKKKRFDIKKQELHKTAHPPLKNLGWEKYNNFQSYYIGLGSCNSC